MKIPSLLLRRLYTSGSLENEEDGFRFGVENRLRDATLTGIRGVRVDGADVPLANLLIELEGRVLRPDEVTPEHPAPFPLQQRASIRARCGCLDGGDHDIELLLEASPFGALDIRARDAIAPKTEPCSGLPYEKDDHKNYSQEIITRRRRFVEKATGTTLHHLSSFSFDPAIARGNIENFTGVAQVPVGFAGPLRINGEHAHGEFLIPLATTEGTLVASYSRGMKVLNLSGGVTCTVSADCMQRAPVFVFDSARDAREFQRWVEGHLTEIRAQAEASSHVAKLLHIEIYLANKFAFLRFNFSTGDAAGQNMVGRATFIACSWILEHNDTIRKFYLESNFATDKKASHVNVMRTRGKRVTAEAVISRAVMKEHLRVAPETLQYHSGVANVAEGSAAIIYSELTSAGDLYLSITIPSLIVATHGGGTGLATQRECLEVLGCGGAGKVNKLAEIVAGVVLAGEISLASAISSLEWVSAHEKHGRKR